jgi:ornithine cyclodeaminase
VQQLDAAFPVIELSDVITGVARARENASQVTIFDSVGFALEDFSSLRYLQKLHRDLSGTRRQLDLVPTLEDPKDLFGALAGKAAAPARIRAV